jgi:hypothetical protein
MKIITHLVLSISLLGLSAHADILELKNGNVLNGKYAGGTPGTVRIETSTGQQVVETSQIIALTFTTTTPAPTAAAPTPAAAAAPAATPASVTLPAGTTLLVRMNDSISSKNTAGTPFTARLEYDLGVNGAVAVKGGTTLQGKVQSSTQAKRARGKSTLDIRLTQIVVGGQPAPIMTSGYQQAGQASIAKAAKGAAAGAAIGAIAGDAGKGAAIGATAGAITKGETITIPPGTLLEFTLTSPVTIRPSP